MGKKYIRSEDAFFKIVIFIIFILLFCMIVSGEHPTNSQFKLW